MNALEVQEQLTRRGADDEGHWGQSAELGIGAGELVAPAIEQADRGHTASLPQEVYALGPGPGSVAANRTPVRSTADELLSTESGPDGEVVDSPSTGFESLGDILARLRG